MYLTKLLLYNAFKARRRAQYRRALEEKYKKKQESKSSIWDIFKFWNKKTNEKSEVKPRHSEDQKDVEDYRID